MYRKISITTTCQYLEPPAPPEQLSVGYERQFLQLPVLSGGREQDHRQPAPDSDVAQPSVLIQPTGAGTAAIPAAVPAFFWRTFPAARGNSLRCCVMDAVKCRPCPGFLFQARCKSLPSSWLCSDYAVCLSLRSVSSVKTASARGRSVYIVGLDAEKVREQSSE